MVKESEIKQSPSTIRPKLEQIQRRSSPRKRPAPKVEEVEDVVVDVVEEPPLAKIKQNESLTPQEEEEEELIEFTKGITNKGATCIWHNGYRYHKHYGTYWRCSNRKCPANAIASEQDDGKIIGKVRNTHTHLPQPEQRLAEIKRQELKQRARDEPHLSRASLIASIRSGIDDETFVALGSDASLSHMAYRFLYFISRLGFRYDKHGTYWRCSVRRCSGSATASEQEDGKIFGKVRNTHSHLPQPEKRLAEIKRQELKQLIRDSPHLSSASIIASIRAGIDDETFVALGSDASLTRMALREKTKLYGKGSPKSASSDLLSLQLPNTLTERNGQSIFLYDSRTVRVRDKGAVFIFAHPYMLQQLAGQITWAIGGSFKSPPNPFKHCFIIGAIFRSQLIVAAHALLTENSEPFYVEALEAVAGAVKPAKPRRIITDFENSMVIAAQKVFPEAHISGCYFRFAQALFKKWTEYNLGALYGHEKSQAGNIARMTFRRLLCLALIPMAYVNRAFYIIAEEAQLTELAEFLFYFKRTFIGLTEHEFQMKSAAFGSNFGQNLIYSAPDDEHNYEVEENVAYEEHVVYSPHIRYEMPPPTHSSSTIIVANQSPPFMQPLRHRPYCPLEFWNISERSATALLNTNSAMEMAQLQIRQGPKQLPSLPDYILAFWDDFEKNRDNIRSASISNVKNKKRNNRKYIIKEELVASTLNEASYETDQAILNTLDMLSHHVQGYVNGLHFDIKNEKMDSSTEFNESINTSGGGGVGRLVIFDTPKPSTSSAFR